MQRKKRTYLLLLFVAAIWGVLALKVIGAMGPDGERPPAPVPPPAIGTEGTGERDTFAIAANYRDPFLGTLPKGDVPKRAKVRTAKRPTPPKRTISLSGSVAQNGTSNRLYFVTIDGQQHIMSKNDKVDGVTLIWGGSGSIRVSYPGHTETIKLRAR